MTQEEKSLLFKDLCARLPYGVKVQVYYEDIAGSGYFDDTVWSIDNAEPFHVNDRWIENIKPYLRPISSMTEEEMDKLFDILHIDKDGKDEDWIKINDDLGIKFFFPTGKWIENVADAYDYLYSIHIDFRGLIPKGLAIEAPKDMYNIK